MRFLKSVSDAYFSLTCKANKFINWSDNLFASICWTSRSSIFRFFTYLYLISIWILLYVCSFASMINWISMSSAEIFFALLTLERKEIKLSAFNKSTLFPYLQHISYYYDTYLLLFITLCHLVPNLSQLLK